jgi:DNA adenine methylase
MTLTLPRSTRIRVPPVKTQGIKTKLVPLIMSSIRWNGEGRWIEPFIGSGVVALNVQAKSALLTDTNKHIIEVYRGIQSGKITALAVRQHLQTEGAILLKSGESHFYAIRDRFNDESDPLDFIFLNRSCFNGMVRFNKKGKFNVPFCRKPDRFRPAYITKICNQVAWAQSVLQGKDWTFKVADWRETLADAKPSDMVYVDPPYIGRHTDYYNNWSDTDADELAKTLLSLNSGFAYSMWMENQYRKNHHLDNWFSDFPTFTFSHFYHVGPTESLRNEMQEALIVSHPHAASELDGAKLIAEFKNDENEEILEPLFL